MGNAADSFFARAPISIKEGELRTKFGIWSGEGRTGEEGGCNTVI